MKKVLAVVLSALMALMCCIPAFAAEKTISTPASAYAEYDRAKVAQNDADYIAAMNYDQIAGVLLDWLDRKIAAVAADFDTFEVEVMGQQISVDLNVTGIDSLLQYKDHIAELGGDFANLDVSALNKTRADGDVNFIYSIFEFVAANADTFGKVFRWDDEVFDYGKVGEFIKANFAEGDAIRDFYDDYLVTGNIQEKFVAEIAREMGYTIPTNSEGQRTETFDETINKGIKAWVSELTGVALGEAYDLKTKDVYTLVKMFVGDLQNEYKAQLDKVFSTILTSVQNAVKAIKDNVNVEAPTLTVGDANGVIGTYHPTSTDFVSYMPKIYSPYKEQLQGTEYYDMIAGETAPEGLVSGDGVAMAEKFVMNVTPAYEALTEAGYRFPIEISFSDIEDYANAQIAAQLPAIQEQVDNAVAQAITAGQSVIDNLPFNLGITLTGSVTINSVTVSLSYKGYATDDTFVVEVTANPAYDITYSGNVWDYASYAGITQEKIQSDYIQPEVEKAVKNPAATIVVENLKGGDLEALTEAKALLDMIDTEAAYDTRLLDLTSEYDDYKGAIGQMNRILVDAVNMILTDAGMTELGLEEGGNDKFDGNLDKLVAFFNEKMAAVESILADGQLAEFAAMAGVDYSGFDANLVDIDFSSKEALLCDVLSKGAGLVEIDNDLIKEIASRISGLTTLDAMAAAVSDIVIEEAVKAVDPEYTYTHIDYADVAEDGARDAIYGKADEIVFAIADKLVEKANTAINNMIGTANEKTGLKIPAVTITLGVEKTGNWETDFEALADRVIALTDGLCILSGNAKDKTGLWAKASELIKVIPINSMLSNYTDLETLDADFFDKALDADIGAFLKYFEVKEDAIAGDVPVTYALIKASDYIVDKFFPDTVQAELYTASLTVQQEFTGAESDQGIAARNMVSINNRKSHIVPAALDLVRELGMLPGFACDHENVENVPEVPSTCKDAGTSAGTRCADCGTVLSGCEALALADHTWGAWTETKAPTCTAKGAETRTCSVCGKTETRDVNAKGHNMVAKTTVAPTCVAEGYTLYECANGCGATEKRDVKAATGNHNYVDGKCTVCGASQPSSGDNGGNGGNFFSDFFAKIRSFFERIINFFKNLF